MNYIATAMRAGGAAFNVVLFLLFAWAGLRLWGISSASFADAGGWAYLRSLASSLSHPASALAAFDGNTVTRLLNLAIAWATCVGAAGSGWMAMLGLRWVATWVARFSAA